MTKKKKLHFNLTEISQCILWIVNLNVSSLKYSLCFIISNIYNFQLPTTRNVFLPFSILTANRRIAIFLIRDLYEVRGGGGRIQLTLSAMVVKLTKTRKIRMLYNKKINSWTLSIISIFLERLQWESRSKITNSYEIWCWRRL